MRTEEEVDNMIEDLKNRTKGRYITQGCSFNKTCPRQMNMLKKALMESVSFSGLVKEMLALRFENNKIEEYVAPKPVSISNAQVIQLKPKDNNNHVKVKNIGNFI